MAYIISNEYKEKLKKLPEVHNGEDSDDFISRIKEFYNISKYEEIITYRNFPRPVPRILKGGIVFTDMGLYKNWPTGAQGIKEVFWASSTYNKDKMMYEELAYYIPCLGYSETKEPEPELIGSFSGRKNINLWDVHYSGEPFYTELIDFLIELQKEIISSDEGIGLKFRDTVMSIVSSQITKIHNDTNWNDIKKHNDILIRYIDSISLDDKQWNDLSYVLFAERMHEDDYENAVSFLLDYGKDSPTKEQKNRVDKLIDSKIKKVDLNPDTVNGLMAFGKYDSKFALKSFEKYLDYYFQMNDTFKTSEEVVKLLNDNIDGYINNIDTDDVKNQMYEMFEEKTDVLIKKFDDLIYVDDYSVYAAGLLSFICRFSNKYKKDAAEKGLEYCCLFEQINDAKYLLSIIDNSKGFDKDDLDKYHKYVFEYSERYGEQYYNSGLKFKEKSEFDQAIKDLKKCVDFCPDNEQYILDLIDVEVLSNNVESALDTFKEVSEKDVKFNSENSERLSQLKVECSENILNDMRAFYLLLKNENYESIKNNVDTLKKVDLQGLSCYHYGIILQDAGFISGYNISEENAFSPVEDYNIMEFACGHTRAHQTYANLMFMYDEDFKEMKAAYNKQRGYIEKKEALEDFINSAVDKTMDRAARGISTDEQQKAFEAKMQELEEKRARILERKSENLERASERASQILESGMNADEEKMIKSLCNFSSGISSEMLKDMFDTNLNIMAEIKFDHSKFDLLDHLNMDSFNSKLIYLLITRPNKLEKIFETNTEDFVLFEEGSSFWYLPEEIINDVEELDYDLELQLEGAYDDCEKKLAKKIKNKKREKEKEKEKQSRAAQEQKNENNNEDIGNISLEEWDKKWVNVGKLNDVNIMDIPDDKGILRLDVDGVICYIIRAIDIGGVRKTVNKILSGENKKSLINRNLNSIDKSKVEVKYLVVNQFEDDLSVCRNLEKRLFEKYKPAWM